MLNLESDGAALDGGVYWLLSIFNEISNGSSQVVDPHKMLAWVSLWKLSNREEMNVSHQSCDLLGCISRVPQLVCLDLINIVFASVVQGEHRFKRSIHMP